MAISPNVALHAYALKKQPRAPKPKNLPKNPPSKPLDYFKWGNKVYQVINGRLYNRVAGPSGAGETRPDGATPTPQLMPIARRNVPV